MSKADNYNRAIKELVEQFYLRYCKEDKLEKEDIDFEYDVDIMSYQGIHNGTVEMFDMYFTIEDIAIAELHKIPTKIFEDYYYLCLDTDGKPGINLLSYWRKSDNPEEYKRKEEEELKKSKERMEKSKKMFEDLLNNK